MNFITIKNKKNMIQNDLWLNADTLNYTLIYPKPIALNTIES
jgi:hypothetical protein